MKNKITFLIFFMSFAQGGCSLILPAAVEFISHESKHMNGDPIYNKVAFQKDGDEDIWLMQQQQGAYNTNHQTWDRLAILVNQKNRTVRYFQLKPGTLNWNSETFGRVIAPKVNCLKCHTNGPRFIRADPNHALPWRDQVRLFVLNEKIKKYDRLKTVDWEPLYFSELSNDQTQLSVKSCTQCHHDGIDGRNILKKIHRETIHFMIENNFMPPRGHKISNEEMALIRNFLD